MNILEHATRNDLPEAAELRHRLAMIHHLTIACIKTTKGISKAAKQELIDTLNRELAGI